MQEAGPQEGAKTFLSVSSEVMKKRSKLVSNSFSWIFKKFHMRFFLIIYSSQEGAAVTQYESLFRTSCVHRRSPNEGAQAETYAK